MAGEKSKNIGEIGENIAKNFFEKIGWGLPQKGVYFPCYKGKEHKLDSPKKQQHGVDFIIPYKSALESETINNLIVSVKHSKESGYPKSATELFKSYIKDLSGSMECFKRSPNRRELTSNHSGYKTVNEIPVLFFISSKDLPSSDFVTQLQASRFINEYDLKELYIVDNSRVTFILDAISYLESHHQDYDWYFFHPVTGMNISDTSIHKHSQQMQIEFINSTFIPFLLKKTVNGHETLKFIVVTKDQFSKESFSKWITYCRHHTGDSISDIEISMPDFYPDDHGPDVNKVLSSYETKVDIKSSNYKPNFRNLADE